MLTIHHLGVSQSERIIWLCEELNVPYELVRYERDKMTSLAPAAYKALHHQGAAPVMTDGGLVLAESGAIIDYIIATYGNGRLAVSKDAPGFADYLYWFHFANGSFMPSMMLGLMAPYFGGTPDHPLMGMVTDRVDKAFAAVETRLGETAYIAGPDFTAADIIILFPLTTMRVFAPKDLTGYPNIRAYLKQIGLRPAYQAAMAKGDPDMRPLLE